MSKLSAKRSRLDSIIYWSVFFFVAVFVTYFLNSMINLANADDNTYSSATLVGYSQTAHLHHSRAEKLLEEEREASGEEDILQ